MADIYEIDIAKVSTTIGYFNSKKILFNRARNNYNSSYFGRTGGTVKKINQKYNIDSQYSKILTAYTNLVLVTQEYLNTCVALETALQKMQLGTLDPAIAASLTGMDGLLDDFNLDQIDLNRIVNNMYVMNERSKFNQNWNKQALASYNLYTGGYYATGVKYNTKAFGSTISWAYATAGFSSSRSNRVGNTASILADYFIDSNIIHDRLAAKKYNTLKKMIQSNKSSCSALSSLSLQMGGCLDEGKYIKHTAMGTPITGNINTRFEGVENLKNCTVVNFKKDNNPSTNKSINSTCKIQDEKVDNYYKYDNLPDKYKVKGAVYIYDTHACVNIGNDTIVSLRENSGHIYTNKSEIVVKPSSNVYPFTHDIVNVILPN